MEFDFETLVKSNGSGLNVLLIPPDNKADEFVSFTGAEPRYPIAPVVRDAVIHMAENGRFGYTLMDGRVPAGCRPLDERCQRIRN